MIVALVIAVLIIVATWIVFTKAGEPGWKCLIPIYNVYIEFKIAKNENFAKYLVITIVSSIISTISGGCWGYAVISGSGAVMIVGAIAFLVAIVLWIWTLVIAYGMYADLAQAFGHERAFAWGLLLLNPIFICILAFENNTYRYGETVAGTTAESFVNADNTTAEPFVEADNTTAEPFVEADNTTADPFAEADKRTAEMYGEADKSSEDTE